jgi:hypothetical protein
MNVGYCNRLTKKTIYVTTPILTRNRKEIKKEIEIQAIKEIPHKYKL